MTQSNPCLNLSIAAVVSALCMQTAQGEVVSNKILAMLSLARGISHPLSSGAAPP